MNGLFSCIPIVVMLLVLLDDKTNLLQPNMNISGAYLKMR